LKQSICRRILDLADSYGARTVAEGVETWADFLAVRELGFDLVQGYLFAKPMSAQKFAKTCWASAQGCLSRARPAGPGEIAFANRAGTLTDRAGTE
jgi:sensor c-di-GMP phosphodiesterase-like protein